jgi:hypothetical protein
MRQDFSCGIAYIASKYLSMELLQFYSSRFVPQVWQGLFRLTSGDREESRQRRMGPE